MEGFNNNQEGFGGMSRMQSPEMRVEFATADELLESITAPQRELIDYALNHIGETERSLQLADDQEQVVAVLSKIIAQEKASDAARIAHAELEKLL